jgi:hypothetical protein
MTESILLTIETPGQFENNAPSGTLPYNATLKEILITNNLPNTGSTLLIGITKTTDFPNLPPTEDWRNIFSYLSNIPTTSNRRIRLFGTTYHLKKLQIPIPKGHNIAIAHYNNAPLPTDTATVQVVLTIEIEEEGERQ